MTRLIAQEQARAEQRRRAAAHELEHGFRGACTDAMQERMAELWEIVHGPTPAVDWGSYEPNTYGGA